jgi:Cu/Ag efflux protein CusF
MKHLGVSQGHSTVFRMALASRPERARRVMPTSFAPTVAVQGFCAPCPPGVKYRPSFLLLRLALLFVASAITACQSPQAKRYPLQAEVISVDTPRKLIVVKHGEIPGLMPAMTMSYAVLDSRDIAPLHAGDKISAELVVADNTGHLEKIVLVTKVPDTAPPSPAK